MAEEHAEPDEPQTPQEELPEFDFADPLKRDGDDSLPGIDPVVTIPPE